MTQAKVHHHIGTFDGKWVSMTVPAKRCREFRWLDDPQQRDRIMRHVRARWETLSPESQSSLLNGVTIMTRENGGQVHVRSSEAFASFVMPGGTLH